MSESVNNSAFIVPEDQNFNTETFQGSMQQVLSENVGSYVIVEFLIGTGQLATKQGLLYYVGTQFLVLLDELESRYIVCDIFSVKFVTFLLPGYRPGSVPSQESSPEEAAPTASQFPGAFRTPAQAAYAHATRRITRR
ncbi:MAG: hypothetical protein IJ507_09745 [Clostridia bacterium]|nr:hypothetical protein [Clostridia bacterium]